MRIYLETRLHEIKNLKKLYMLNKICHPDLGKNKFKLIKKFIRDFLITLLLIWHT